MLAMCARSGTAAVHGDTSGRQWAKASVLMGAAAAKRTDQGEWWENCDDPPIELVSSYDHYQFVHKKLQGDYLHQAKIFYNGLVKNLRIW